jgi:lipoate-protein ligase A
MDEWRFIESGPCPATMNMAIDEALAHSVREGASPPVLRVYAWTTPSVSIGCFQKIDAVNLPCCADLHIPVVRRPTGGRAVLHGDELTYSFSAPTGAGPFSKGLMDSYHQISRALCRAVSVLGPAAEARTTRAQEEASGNPLCFHSASFAEITVLNRKLVGSAQKRWRDGLLQQGSIPYVLGEMLIKKVFNIDAPVDLRERMIGLREVVPDLDPAHFRETVRRSFEETFGVPLTPSALSREESLHAAELEARKYQSRAWTLQR